MELNVNSIVSALIGGGTVSLLAGIIWSQLNLRIEAVEKKISQMDGVVRKDDCRQDRKDCSGNLGRSIDEIKTMISDLRKDIYTINGGRRETDHHTSILG